MDNRKYFPKLWECMNLILLFFSGIVVVSFPLFFMKIFDCRLFSSIVLSAWICFCSTMVKVLKEQSKIEYEGKVIWVVHLSILVIFLYTLFLGNYAVEKIANPFWVFTIVYLYNTYGEEWILTKFTKDKFVYFFKCWFSYPKENSLH